MSSSTLTKWLSSSCRTILSRHKLQNVSMESVRFKTKEVNLPQVFGVGGRAGIYRRIVHYPEKYTIKPLEVTNLGGRDPVSGRVVVKGIGGGIKRKYHWIEWKREGPKEGPPTEEKVLEIMIDWCRTARIALVGSGNTLKYILATENMKAGDIIKTSQHIPRIPVLPNEGDAYPLGALSMGTIVHSVEKYPGGGGHFVHAAGSFAILVRKMENFVIVMLPSKKEVALPQECMATVGRLSNVEHSKTPIGSAQRNRELGNRPRSGLWQRKTGRFGRKIKAPPPLQKIVAEEKVEPKFINLSLNCDDYYHHKLWSKI